VKALYCEGSADLQTSGGSIDTQSAPLVRNTIHLLGDHCILKTVNGNHFLTFLVPFTEVFFSLQNFTHSLVKTVQTYQIT